MPLFGHAGWGEILDTLVCVFLCAEVGIVGLALAGAVFRSPVLVGLSFVPAVFIVVTIGLSGTGYAVLAVTLLAPWVAVCSLLPNRRPHPDSPGGIEVPVVPSHADADPVAWGPFVAKLFALCLLLMAASLLAMLFR